MSENSAAVLIGVFQLPSGTFAEQQPVIDKHPAVNPQDRHCSITDNQTACNTAVIAAEAEHKHVTTDVIQIAGDIALGNTTALIIDDAAIEQLYLQQHEILFCMARQLLYSNGEAEEVVQDAYASLLGRRIRDLGLLESYARSSVLNLSRTVLRHRAVIEKYPPKPLPNAAPAEAGAIELIERSQVIAALRDLPDRQREVMVLRYYGDLSEAEIASTMGISRGAVKSHAARAMTALRDALQDDFIRY